jgi:hypothetical protein
MVYIIRKYQGRSSLTRKQYGSVRARALGSLLSGIIAVTTGNILGQYLDRTKIPLRTRARSTFWVIVVLQGAWWLWATVLVTEFRDSKPTYDWLSPGFGRAFAVFIFLTAGFQMNYLFLYFMIGQIAVDEPEVIRYAALLRGTESAWQAVSYGITSVTVFAEVGAVYWNFALWGVAVLPAWLVIEEFGTGKVPRAQAVESGSESYDQHKVEEPAKGVLS